MTDVICAMCEVCNGTKRVLLLNHFAECECVRAAPTIEDNTEYDQGSGIFGYFQREITMWRVKGKIHRLGGPAYVGTAGDEWWYKYSNLHRVGGPAITRADGATYWYLDGRLHNPTGPAIVRPCGAKYWYQNGRFHNLSGPSMETSSGNKSWYIEGKGLTEEQFQNDPRVLQAQAA